MNNQERAEAFIKRLAGVKSKSKEVWTGELYGTRTNRQHGQETDAAATPELRKRSGEGGTRTPSVTPKEGAELLALSRSRAAAASKKPRRKGR